jgi:hypothetical protein
MMGIISEFQEAVKELVKATTEVGKSMGEGGAAMGKSAGKMGAAAALLEEAAAEARHGAPHASDKHASVAKGRGGGDGGHGGETVLALLEAEAGVGAGTATRGKAQAGATLEAMAEAAEGHATMLRNGMGMDPGAALEKFAKSVVDARHAQMEWGDALVDKAAFQVATAKKANDKCAEAKALANMAKAQEIKYAVRAASFRFLFLCCWLTLCCSLGLTDHFWPQATQDMGRAKNDQASAAEKAKLFAKGVPLEGDRQFKLDVPLGSNEKKFNCIKFDLFGCGCKSLPSYETLSGGDCSDLKNIITKLRENDFKKATAMGFQGEGKNSAEKYGECVLLLASACRCFLLRIDHLRISSPISRHIHTLRQFRQGRREGGYREIVKTPHVCQTSNRAYNFVQ